MKTKKLAALFLAVLTAAALSGCNQNDIGVPEDTSPSAETSAPVPVEALPDKETETTKLSVTEPEEAPPQSDLTELKYKELEQIFGKLAKQDGGRLLADGTDASSFKVVSADKVSVGAENAAALFRQSTNILSTDTEQRSSFDAAADAAKHSNSAAELSDYSVKDNGVTFKLSLDNSLTPTAENALFGYTIDEASFCAFVTGTKDGAYTVVIDPAYMYNIPVPVSCGGEYSVGGKRVLMDSISFTAQKLTDKEYTYSGWVYAQMTVKDLNVEYDENGGSFSSAEVTEFSVIDENTINVLESAELVKKFEEKDDSAAAVYKTLTDNIDMFMGDDVVGVELIDLDFDGTPELLVSRNYENSGLETVYGADVDIYILKDGKTEYVDTLYNDINSTVGTNGNVIGIKTTDKLEKKWYYMCRGILTDGKPADEIFNDADYLFTLENGKLKYTEVFSKQVKSFAEGTDMPSETEYRFLGEKIVPKVTLGYGPYAEEGDPEDWEYLSWNGIDATFGMWELYGFVREEYCKDIEPVFALNSDWLCSNDIFGGFKKITVNERTVQYKLAYLVDAFYYGSYDSASERYEYRFLGDYAKPVIYLYPEEKTDVSVKLDFDGTLTCTYPEYNGGWNVTAYPDGTLIDRDGEEYYCLYWEGVGKADWDMSKGFVVKRDDTAAFLRSKLKEIGLTPRESNEFIIYWLPELKKNECNYITFQTDIYEANARLEVSPEPDSALRIFMVYEPCSPDREAVPQEFGHFERSGFTLVEWGGSKADKS